MMAAALDEQAVVSLSPRYRVDTSIPTAVVMVLQKQVLRCRHRRSRCSQGDIMVSAGSVSMTAMHFSGGSCLITSH